MPRDPLTEDELIAELMGDAPAEPVATDSTVAADDIAEVIAFAAAVAAAEHGGGRPEFQRVYLARAGRVVFVFDVGAVVLDLHDHALTEMQPAAEALLH